MKVIYGIVSGEYSDYSVHFTVADEETAGKIVAKLNAGKDAWDRFESEKFILIESETDVFTTTIFCVETNAEGFEVRRWTYEENSWEDSRQRLSNAWYSSINGGICGRGASERGYDVALKIAQDKIKEFKAKGGWSMIITVTAEDIRNGRPQRPAECPLAIAIGRAIGEPIHFLGDVFHLDSVCLEDNPPNIRVPVEVFDWFMKYDNYEPVEPITFEIPWPPADGN